MADALSRAYAQGLFNAAKAASRVGPVAEALGVLHALWLAEPRLGACLAHPSLDRAARLNLADKATAPLGEELVRALLGVMVRKGRAHAVPGVITAYLEIKDAAEGVRHAEVTSVALLSSGSLDRLGAALSKRLGGSFRLAGSTDPSLLGGVRIRIDDKVFDASLRRSLNELEARLSAQASANTPHIWDN
ncbi:MAG: ATP synthase F1 subunit delta [Planctomycetota bacterium]